MCAQLQLSKSSLLIRHMYFLKFKFCYSVHNVSRGGHFISVCVYVYMYINANIHAYTYVIFVRIKRFVELIL